MPEQFKAEVFQNAFLPAGSREVHAIVTVTLAGRPEPEATGDHVFGVLCDVSGSMEGLKLQAAKEALEQIVALLPESSFFFLVAGSDSGALLAPLRRADAQAKQEALYAIRGMRAFGGTRISHWLQAAQEQFRGCPGALRQALLLTDGQNDANDTASLQATLQACEGVFQCDCRGVGTDWQVEQLRMVAARLLGTVDLIATPQQMGVDFRSILAKALAKSVSDVALRLWTPVGATVRFVKEVSPAVVDLTGRARDLRPQLREYPTGAWAEGESRDFHVCLEVAPGAVGDEMLAGRVSLLRTLGGAESKVGEARILAVWTDDERRSAKIDRVVAHYTGQAELASSIQEGMEARARGESDKATALLGKAVQIAHESGNEATAKLLRRVVDVEDASRGTVRLKGGVSKEDAMTLETRSTKTARIAKT